MLSASQPDFKERVADEVPLGRTAEPEEVGRAVEFLIRHDYLTGETINVSGGRHIAL
jgi:NAD(P)-dependent dehydrogenase (short-subunit alcohol dehydrogenase family)